MQGRLPTCPTDMDRLETDILAELIAKKRELLLELRALTFRQAELVESGETSALMSILSGKQTLLSQVQRLEQGLDHFRGQDPEQREWRGEAERRRCRGQAEECEQLVNELMRIEKLCEASMIARRDALAGQLQSAGSAAAAREAYTGKPRPTSTGFDMQSEG